MFEFGKEALDAPSVAIGDAAIVARLLAVSARRDDDGAALRFDFLAQAVGVVRFVSKNLLGLQAIDEIAGGSHIVLLARPEVEAHRQAERIDYSVDFSAEPAAGAPESLGFLAPLLSGAPAAWA